MRQGNTLWLKVKDSVVWWDCNLQQMLMQMEEYIYIHVYCSFMNSPLFSLPPWPLMCIPSSGFALRIVETLRRMWLNSTIKWWREQSGKSSTPIDQEMKLEEREGFRPSASLERCSYRCEDFVWEKVVFALFFDVITPSPASEMYVVSQSDRLASSHISSQNVTMEFIFFQRGEAYPCSPCYCNPETKGCHRYLCLSSSYVCRTQVRSNHLHQSNDARQKTKPLYWCLQGRKNKQCHTKLNVVVTKRDDIGVSWGDFVSILRPPSSFSNIIRGVVHYC